MSKKFRVTYATLSADNEDLQAAYDQGVKEATAWLGRTLHGVVDGAPCGSGQEFNVVSPHDRGQVLGTFQAATGDEVATAIAAARREAFSWAQTPWQQRISVLRKAADLISERSNEFGALMSMEVGKNRLEALGDVEESADLIRYYCDQMEQGQGFDQPMGTIAAHETTRSVLKPHGVWAVIAPFNFPMALVAGPVGAALVAGNTVVAKPNIQGSFSAVLFWECLADAGLPSGVANLVLGGDEAGKALVAHPDVDGITFTGSSAVGMSIASSFTSSMPKPVICEMGGKNPTVVSDRADIAKAALGVARSAFGLSGQKCSACSRVYVHRDVHDEFVQALVERAQSLVIGDPTARDTYLGPVIDQVAVTRFVASVDQAKADGAVIATGGSLATDRPGLEQGNYVTPTVVTGLPVTHALFRDELFLPFVVVAPVDSVEEGLRLANDTQYGLTAGFFSEDPAEVERFLAVIEAGVVYVNRPAGATTGAWPGVQPFGGWKRSGGSGKAGGGPHYVQQYMREQSQTVVS